MTYQEAIEILQEERDYAQFLSYVNEALKIAIESLEKQIPKKIINQKSLWCICPSCGGSLFTKKSNVKEHIANGAITHCEHCGQAIDWSDIK